MIQGKTEVLVGNSSPLPFYLSRIPQGLGWEGTWFSAVFGRRTTVWAMAWSRVGNVWKRILRAQFKFGWVVRCA